MKKTICLMCVSLFILGCNQQESKIIQGSQTAGIEKKKLEVIVVFKEGISIEKAKKQIVSQGMIVSHIYKTLSKASKKPMLLVDSPFREPKTDKILKNNPFISSFSYNHSTQIEPDPSKPQ